MALKITKAHEPIEVNQITMCIYSVPGIGKTSTAFTADSPLLFDFDRGSYRAANRKDVVEVETWADVARLDQNDFAGYKTAVVDTGGRALDVLTSHIISDNPKAATKSGALSLQGYGELKAVFIAWLKRLRSFGMDVVIVCHSEEQGKDEDLKERLDIQGGSKGEIYKASDCMGRLYIEKGKRMLNFSPTDTAFGKNPASLPPLQVPNFVAQPGWLGERIAEIKASLNKLSAEQTEVTALMAAWTEQIQGVTDADGVNELITASQSLDKRILAQGKALLMKVATERLKLTFDKNAKVFVAQKQVSA